METGSKSHFHFKTKSAHSVAKVHLCCKHFDSILYSLQLYAACLGVLLLPPLFSGPFSKQFLHKFSIKMRRKSYFHAKQWQCTICRCGRYITYIFRSKYTWHIYKHKHTCFTSILLFIVLFQFFAQCCLVVVVVGGAFCVHWLLFVVLNCSNSLEIVPFLYIQYSLRCFFSIFCWFLCSFFRHAIPFYFAFCIIMALFNLCIWFTIRQC